MEGRLCSLHSAGIMLMLGRSAKVNFLTVFNSFSPKFSAEAIRRASLGFVLGQISIFHGAKGPRSVEEYRTTFFFGSTPPLGVSILPFFHFFATFSPCR